MSRPLAHVRLFAIVFVALLLLLGLTVEAARHDLGRWNFPLAASIASVKTLLIALFFMELRHSR
ncbi:MAG: cytochrome C oxidase subunit IV family protein, partial [Acidobacteria bacterium]|nr:cytochrome C oxidase subunit IV family protein [Acidobacteriota bacterium]